MKRFIFYSTFLILFSQNILFAQWVQTNGPGGGEVKAIVKDSFPLCLVLPVKSY